MFHWRKRKAFLIVGALILLGIGVATYTFRPAPVAIYQATSDDTLPSQLDDVDFWEMIESFSEPGGTFRSDNFLSNESGLQDVIPRVKERVKPGSVYIGVGPEQNFTYILAFQPKISFVIDIRRLNMLEHLLYKAIFELSEDRADFVSALFSRPRPKGLTEKTGVQELFSAFDKVDSDNALLEHNLLRVRSQLMGVHHFPLSQSDEMQIRYVLSNFAQAGPNLSYSFRGSFYQGTLAGMPTYKQLMADTDGKGHNWSFLATEQAFEKIQDIQRKNLIVPIVGDFAGPKAIRAVGRYMKKHDALLSVFYTSNVEMYLFQQGDDWKDFYENVATLPLNSASTFVRFAAGRGRRFGSSADDFTKRSQMWSPVLDVIESVRNREFDEYAGVLDMSE